MVVWKNLLGDMTKHTTDLQDKMQYCNNLLKNGYVPRNNLWAGFWVTLWASIKYVLPAITFPNIEA